MAGFEQAHAGVVVEATKAWRAPRYLPLHLACVAAGAALALSVTLGADGGASKTPSGAPVGVAPVAAPPVTVGLAAQPRFTSNLPPDAGIVLPDAFTAIWLAPPTAPSDGAPAAEAAPAQPVPSVNVAPAPAPAAAPVTSQPAPAPAAAPVADPKPNFYLPAPSAGPATALEQQLFDGINAQRAAAGLAPYVFDAGLSRIARIRSTQLADQQYFGHVDPYGYSMYVELLAHFGYSYAWAGENLALNNYASSEAASRALTSLMNSPSHRANLLARDFSRIGVGEITLADGRHYFTMIFLS